MSHIHGFLFPVVEEELGELIERLRTDTNLRRICGWLQATSVPSECSFFRSFAKFAKSNLPQRVHEVLVKEAYADQLVGDLSRDASEYCKYLSKKVYEATDGQTTVLNC